MKEKKKRPKSSPYSGHWEKLDNTAHLFPVIAGESMSNVYRISANLTEQIQGELLQEALNIVLPRFPGFNLRLRAGVFWHYFEENGKPAPRVREENTYPCREIPKGKNHSYLFRVTYYQNRINLEVFHSLADGMGGLTFLRELTYQYLRLAHPELRERLGDGLHCDTSLNREDSFLKHYHKKAPKKYQTSRAYQMKGEKLLTSEMGVLHGRMPVSQLKEVCRKYNCSINEYLVGVFAWSIYTEYLHGLESENPIRIAVPVNLRRFFDSITTKNFFVMISAVFTPKEESYTFEEVLSEIRVSLNSQMNRQHLEEVFSYNVSNEKIVMARMVPLFLKNLAMRSIYTRSALANTTTVTNIGDIQVSDEYKPYIKSFYAMLAMSKGQHLKGAICSYMGELIFTFSYDLKDISVQRCFFRKIAADGVDVRLESNGVNYE